MSTTVRFAPEASGFPVHWDDPADEQQTFTSDLMHNPHPMSPLSQSLTVFPYGMAAAAEELGLPIPKPDVRYLNYYQFTRQEAPELGSPDGAEERERAIEETMRRETGRLDERWRDEHLPRIRELIAEMERMESAVPTASASDIVSMLDELTTLSRELWTIHFRIAYPMLIAIQAFDELYVDLFGGAEADSYALLVGRPSMSVQAGIALFDLATGAREAGLDRLIVESPLDEIVPGLRATASGRDFLGRLEEYLRVFGLRQDLFDIMTPTWRENPSIPLASIRAYLLNGHDPRADHEARARSAEAAAAKAREQLASYPEPVRNQFEAMLRAARDGAFLQEEHNFYIDQHSLAWGRLIFMQIGRRLVELGAIDAPDDVFMLRVDEVRTLLLTPVDSEAGRDTRVTVVERRDGMERARSLTPPAFIGPPPEAPPDNVMGRTMTRFFGGPPQAAEAPDQLKGAAGSRGIVSGPAFLARTLDEAKAILPGHILVTITTMPAWTPFFGVAAAVVTETGGALSHCAIVAREYGIPAVVGAHGAMRAISSGQMITVDGDRGIVSLVTPDA